MKNKGAGVSEETLRNAGPFFICHEESQIQFTGKRADMFESLEKNEKTKRVGFVEKWAKAEQTSAFLGISLNA